MNYLITGFPGMGKSTIAKELKKRGHIAYDPQAMQSYMHIISRETGKHIKAPSAAPHDWYEAEAEYDWDLVKVESLLSSDEDVFICSLAQNQDQLYDQFKLIFVLTLDFTELTTRLTERPGKAIGKADSELSDILSKHENFEQSLLNKGAIRINVGKPIPEVVDQILLHVSKQS